SASGPDMRYRVERDAIVSLDGNSVDVTSLREGDRIAVVPVSRGERATRSVSAFRDVDPVETGGGRDPNVFRGTVVRVDESQWNRTVQRLNDEFRIDEIVEDLRPYLGEDLDAEQLEAQFRSGVQSGLRTLALKTFGIAGAAIGFIGSF